MRSRRKSPTPKASQRIPLHSFTLVEMLVSISVLSLMLLLMAQMTSMIDNAWRTGQSRVDNFTRARALLDVAAQDIQRGVFRPDLPAFGTLSSSINLNGTSGLVNTIGYSTNAFYTRRPGVSANTVRDLSLVVYALNVGASSATLSRADYSVPWPVPTSSGITSWAGYLPFQSSLGTPVTALGNQSVLQQASFRNAAEGVVDFELVFQRADGSMTNSYPGYSANPVTAIGIGVAVVDAQTEKVLISANKLSTLHTALTYGGGGAFTGTNSIKSDWDAKMNSGSFYSGYPAQLGTGLKTFERYVTCEPGF